MRYLAKAQSYVFFYAVIFLLVEIALSRPFNKNVEDYLTQFGYLPRSNSESMRSHHQIETAVKNLQFYAGLNVTGIIDQGTADLMTKYSLQYRFPPRFLKMNSKLLIALLRLIEHKYLAPFCNLFPLEIGL